MIPSASCRRPAAWIAFGLVAVLGPGVAGGAPQSAERRILVSAAISLTDALGEVASAFERATGIGVDVNVGASSSLARQIIEGAPVDLFLSADEAQMDRVERAGRLVPGSRIDVLSNQLVVVTPADRAGDVTSVHDLQRETVRRVAIADPAAVPAGVYAREYLERVGLWVALQPKLIPTPHVRGVLAVVETGDVDAGFVYRTDAATAGRARIAFDVPADQTSPIRYPMAIGRATRDLDAARRFAAFLLGSAAADIFRRLGFVVIEPAVARAGGRASRHPGDAW